MYKFDPLNPTDCPYFLIYRVSHLATTLMKQELAKLEMVNVNPAYLVALIYLWNALDDKKKGLRPNELAKSTGLGSSTMTSLIDRMERDGLVKRENEPLDRRAHLVCLTEKGEKFKLPILKAIDDTMIRILKNFSDTEIEEHKNFLRKVLLNIMNDIK